MKRALIAAVVLASCTRGEHREAREKYNDGLAALAKGELADAEKLLLEARGAAGVDPELRFRAAYDLGLAFAAHADKEKGELAKAIALEQQAVSWFADALDLRKDDRDAAANLTIARARLQAMNDELRRGEAKLEARLDAAIGNQRGVLAGARGAWQPIKKTHGADPLGQQSALQRLADDERGIGAEVGVIEDLATDEVDTIAKKAEDKRSPEEKARIVQLKNLGVYIADARSRVADARRRLQQLAAEEAVGRAESALVALKRAREQLLDPITVLRGVGADELELARDTTATADASGKRLDAGSAAPRAALPAWLAPGALLERQTALRERLDEVRARLGAATQAPPSPSDEKQDARAKKLIERVKRAVPLVADASAAMDRARTGLGDKKLDDALVAERDALVAIGKAIEQFADLKQTIDLASETQKRVVELLGPDAAKQMTAAERARETKEGIAQNAARVERLKELIADEREQEDEKKKSPGAGSGAGSSAKDDEKQKEIEARIEQLKTAEVLRADAAKLVAELDAAIAKNGDALAAAKAVDAKLDELRKLFFSVIEHLEQLVLDQNETQDRTNAASGDDDAARAPKLPELIAREDQHGAMAKAITDALAAQADAANKQPQGQQQQQRGPSGKQLAAAAEEVRLGGGDMADAKAAIDKARTTTTQTISLKPAVEAQTKAITHLKNALALLQPPKQQKQEDDKQQDQQPQPQPQSGAGQRARDEDAKRQRRRHGGNEPVEKDW